MVCDVRACNTVCVSHDEYCSAQLLVDLVEKVLNGVSEELGSFVESANRQYGYPQMFESWRKFSAYSNVVAAERKNLRPDSVEHLHIYTESSKYYARMQTAVARGLGLPTFRLAGHHTDAASKHSLCYFSLFSE